MNDIKEKTNITPPEPEVSKYYEGVSTAFRYAKFITLVITVFFVVFLLSVFKEEITLQNFRYTLKYITSDESSLITTKKIYYPTSDSKALDLFNGDFVSAGSSGISVYDTYGNTVLEIDKTFSQPFMSFGRKYGLCYDLSGNSYSIFSSFAELHTQKTEYPIYGASMASNGNYAILTSNREYKTVLELYNPDFELISRIYKDELTFAFAIDQKHLAYASVKASDSKYLTSFTIVKNNSENEIQTYQYYDEFPLYADFINDGLILLTDKSLRFFTDEFGMATEISLSERTYNNYISTDSYVVLCFGKNIIGSENELVFYDKNGQKMFDHIIHGKIKSIDASEKCTLILTNTSVIRLDLENGKVDECYVDSGASKVMLQADSTALVCYSNYAELIDFKSIDNTALIKYKEN